MASVCSRSGGLLLQGHSQEPPDKQLRSNQCEPALDAPWLEPNEHARHHQAGQRHQKRVEADSMFVEESGFSPRVNVWPGELSDTSPFASRVRLGLIRALRPLG